MRLTIIESPFAGDIQTNIKYAQLCLRDSLGRGEAPYASHLLYTQPHVLDDDNPAEREWGIQAGFAWGQVADVVALYIDRGISRGMLYGVEAAQKRGTPIELRTIPAEQLAMCSVQPAPDAREQVLAKLPAELAQQLKAE